MVFVISLHDYAVFVVTSDPMTRTLLPRIMALLGQDKVSFYTKVTEALPDLRISNQPKLFFVDGEKHIEDLGTYRDRLYNAFVFVMMAPQNDAALNHSVCSADDCLHLLNDLKHYIGASIEEKNAYFLKHAHPQTIVDTHIPKKEDYIYQSFSLPVESVEIYKLFLPFTVRSVTQALRTILPEQTVHTHNTYSVHYKLLENSKEKRLNAYRPDVL